MMSAIDLNNDTARSPLSTTCVDSRPRSLSEDEEIISLQYKVIILGDGAVGKTSIAKRFAEDQFNQMYKQTVGVDFFIRRLKLPPNYQIALQLWDIGGQSIGSKMVTNYIAGAHAVLLCYDITNYESFANLEDWYRLVLKTFHGKDLPYTVLIGNKCKLNYKLLEYILLYTHISYYYDLNI